MIACTSSKRFSRLARQNQHSLRSLLSVRARARLLVTRGDAREPGRRHFGRSMHRANCNSAKRFTNLIDALRSTFEISSEKRASISQPATTAITSILRSGFSSLCRC